MRKHYLFLAALAAVMTVLSCQKDPKEEPVTPEEPDTPVVEKVYSLDVSAPADAVAVNGTKTTMVPAGADAYAVNWISTDVIRVNGTASTAITVNSTDAKKASFSFESGVTAPYKSIYPSSVYKSDGVITLPASQTYQAGTYDPAAAIMAGYSESGSLAFNHLMAYLLITPVNKSGEKIKSITLRSRGTEPMSGDFNISFTPSVSMAAASADGAAVMLNCGEGIAPETPVVIAIPAQNYANGFTVTVIDAASRTTTLAAKSAFDATAGKVYRTGLDVSEVGIWSEADFEAFAAAANAGDYSAWVGSDGDVDLFVDIARDENLTYIASFDGTFEGNGHTISIAQKTRPIFNTLAAGAVIKNLTLAGTYTGFENAGEQAFASFARVNLGTIQDCTNETSGDITSSSAVAFGGFVGQNGGTIKDCVNNGNIHLTMSTTASMVCYGGGFAAWGHTVTGGMPNSSSQAGTFDGCVNNGEVIVTVTNNGSIVKTGFGGICGSVMLDGVVFRNCTNGTAAKVHRIDDGAANNTCASAVGGIVGRSARFHNSTEFVDMDGNIAKYNVTFEDCTNEGSVLNSVRNGHNFQSQSNDELGNKKVMTGGIVGGLVGKDAAQTKLIRCKNTGSVQAGFNTNNNSHVLGGLVGCVRNATLTDCEAYGTVSSYGSNITGPVGGMIGYSLAGVTISGGKAKAALTINKATVSKWSYGLVVGCTRTASNPAISGMQIGGSIMFAGADQGVSSSNFTNFICVNNHWTDRKPSVSSCTWLD